MADATDTKWKVYRPDWYNERILETFIISPIVDKQNDKIGTDTIKESMDFYMKYGVYSYKHEEMPVGLPLAYKIKDGKVKLRVGVHNRLPMHDRVWEEMKIYGDKGGSSIRGEAEKQEKVCEGDVCHNNISALSLWSVSWVGNRPANPEATVTEVAAAKEAPEPIKVTKQVTLDEVQGMIDNALEKKLGRRGSQWCILHHRTPGKIGKPIKGACHPTRRQAERQHAAMNARRFGKARKKIDEILFKMRLDKIDKHIWDIAGIKKCAVKKGIEVIKAPKRGPLGGRRGSLRGRRGKGPTKNEFENCKNNTRKLRGYYGQRISKPENFCGKLWWKYASMRGGARKPNPEAPGTGGQTPANVKDPVGYEFRRAMFSAKGPNLNKNPNLTPQNIRRILGEGKRRGRGPRTGRGGRTRYKV